MSEEMPYLRPCPFCGGDAKMFREADEDQRELVSGHGLMVASNRTFYGVRCEPCDITMDNPHSYPRNAAAHWNRRAK